MPNIAGSRTNGATKKIGNNIMLMVNDRRLNADSFWFTLFHEIGHIMNGDYGISFEKETGVQEEAAEFSDYLANEGADQCGYCSPGLIMNVLALKREIPNPTMAQIKEYLSGNLCRCTGYQGQYRALAKYFGVEE